MLGTCASLDRPNGVASVFIDGVGTAVPCRYFGDPPPPLSRVDLSQPAKGQWICRGPEVDSRVLLHDDFLTIPAGTFSGDTPWTGRGTIAVYGQYASSFSGSMGVVGMAAPATANIWGAISKDNDAIIVPAAPVALWFSGRVTTSVLTSTLILAGLADSAFTGGTANNYATLAFRTDQGQPDWTLLTQNANGAQVYLDAAVPPVSSTFIDFDIVLVGSLFAALWINGNGPYTTTGATVPVVGAALTPFFAAYPFANVAVNIFIDWVHIERVASVQNPSLPPFKP